eukprot:1842869-Rhodomonas_salina.7
MPYGAMRVLQHVRYRHNVWRNSLVQIIDSEEDQDVFTVAVTGYCSRDFLLRFCTRQCSVLETCTVAVTGYRSRQIS